MDTKKMFQTAHQAAKAAKAEFGGSYSVYFTYYLQKQYDAPRIEIAKAAKKLIDAGKKVVLRFKKADKSITERTAISLGRAEYVKLTDRKAAEHLITFFDCEKQEVRSCKFNNVLGFKEVAE